MNEFQPRRPTTTPRREQCITIAAGDWYNIKMSNIFSSENDEILIEEVRQNTVLYDSKDIKHKDIVYKDEIWKHIAVKVGKPCKFLSRNYSNICTRSLNIHLPSHFNQICLVEDCKKRWKNIRDTYIRNRKRPSTGSASSAKKTWLLADRVSFLNTVEHERK